MKFSALKVCSTLAAAAVMFAAVQAQAFDVPAKNRDTANYLGQTAMDQLTEGDIVSATASLKQAVQVNPYDPRWRIEYFKLIRMQATAAMKQNQLSLGRQLFKAAEKQLLAAANIFSQLNQQKQAADLYFQIGQINETIFKKRRTAFAYYKRAAALHPGHTDSIGAIQRLTR